MAVLRNRMRFVDTISVKVSVNDGVGPAFLEEPPTLLISSLQDTRLISKSFFLFRNQSRNIDCMSVV
jgi:hypothetical protein